MQTNTITDALHHAFGVDRFYTGLVITLVTGSIIAGGFKAIARFAERVVPLMGLVLCLAQW